MPDFNDLFNPEPFSLDRLISNASVPPEEEEKEDQFSKLLKELLAQTPEALSKKRIEEFKERAFGIEPGKNPTKMQRAKMLMSELGGAIGHAGAQASGLRVAPFESAEERVRARALEEFKAQSPRLSTAVNELRTQMTERKAAADRAAKEKMEDARLSEARRKTNIQAAQKEAEIEINRMKAEGLITTQQAKALLDRTRAINAGHSLGLPGIFGAAETMVDVDPADPSYPQKFKEAVKSLAEVSKKPGSDEARVRVGSSTRLMQTTDREGNVILTPVTTPNYSATGTQEQIDRLFKKQPIIPGQVAGQGPTPQTGIQGIPGLTPSTPPTAAGKSLLAGPVPQQPQAQPMRPSFVSTTSYPKMTEEQKSIKLQGYKTQAEAERARDIFRMQESINNALHTTVRLYSSGQLQEITGGWRNIGNIPFLEQTPREAQIKRGLWPLPTASPETKAALADFQRDTIQAAQNLIREASGRQFSIPELRMMKTNLPELSDDAGTNLQKMLRFGMAANAGRWKVNAMMWLEDHGYTPQQAELKVNTVLQTGEKINKLALEYQKRMDQGAPIDDWEFDPNLIFANLIIGAKKAGQLPADMPSQFGFDHRSWEGETAPSVKSEKAKSGIRIISIK